MIPERFTLLLIKQKSHNKRFGEFEFEYFGDSDVMNKLLFFQAVFALVVLAVATSQASPVAEAEPEARRGQRQAPAVAVPLVRKLN